MKKRLAVYTALVLFVCSTVSATPTDTVDISRDGYGAKSVMRIWGSGHYGQSVRAGVYMLNKTAGSGTGELWEDGLIEGFCIDLQQYSSYNTKTYSVVEVEQGLNGTLGQQKADYLCELWGRYYDPAWSNGSPYSAQENEYAEAFAAAIWEIVNEDIPVATSGWDVTVDGTVGYGGFRATGLNSSLANTWLSSLDGTGPKTDLNVFSNCQYQDYLVAAPVPVPEPATIAILGMGGIFLLRRGKK